LDPATLAVREVPVLKNIYRTEMRGQLTSTSNCATRRRVSRLLGIDEKAHVNTMIEKMKMGLEMPKSWPSAIA
jgi:hypothetical protein